MKKLIFILSLFTTISIAQKPGRIFTKCGSPTTSISGFDNTKDVLWDSCGNAYYKYAGVPLKWQTINFAKGAKGDAGSNGIQGIQGIAGQAATISVGTTTTLPAGTNAVVTNTGTSSNAIFNFGIPQGQQGQSGGGSGGASADCLPVSYGGKTFAQLGLNQAFIDANYGGMGITVNDTRDLAELMLCEKSGKPIGLTGDMGINRGLLVAKMRYFFTLYLNDRKIYTTNDNVFSMIYCDLPATLNEAEQMAVRCFKIVGNGILKGTKNQIGLDIGAGSGHVFDYVEFEGLKTGNHMKFAMESIDNRSRFTRCTNGVLLDYYRNLPDAPFKSPCNKSTLNTPKYWTDEVNTTGVAIGIYSGDGIIINNPVIQGGNASSTATIKYGIECDDMGSTTVKNFTINSLYQEMNGGITGATIRLKLMDATFVLNGSIGHHPAILIDSKSCGAPTNINVNYVTYNKRKAGKSFDTVLNGASYQFNYSKLASDPEGEINTQNYKTAVSQLFVTPSTISFCSDVPNTNCGYGRYGIILNGR